MLAFAQHFIYGCAALLLQATAKVDFSLTTFGLGGFASTQYCVLPPQSHDKNIAYKTSLNNLYSKCTSIICTKSSYDRKPLQFDFPVTVAYRVAKTKTAERDVCRASASSWCFLVECALRGSGRRQWSRPPPCSYSSRPSAALFCCWSYFASAHRLRKSFSRTRTRATRADVGQSDAQLETALCAGPRLPNTH